MATTTRRSFITKTAMGIAGLGFSLQAGAKIGSDAAGYPVVISTGEHGLQSNDAAWRILSAGGYSVDAVEAGIRLAEADPEVTTAGYGAFPNARGKVTLNASMINEKGEAGSVALLECIKHPVSVARVVMEQTPHLMLSGKGAQQFALAKGFEKEKLLTREMRRQWKEWKKEKPGSGLSAGKAARSEKSTSTISMLAIDEKGRLCGACSNSGMAYAIPGSITYASLVGSGLFVDGKTGAAVAAGQGSLKIKTLGSFLVVEYMRGGMSPDEACNAAIVRIIKENPDFETHQIGLVALSASGEIGAASLQPGFKYAVKTNIISELREAGAWFKKL